MRRIILHVGFHKTGTTSLQRTVQANRKAPRPAVRLIRRAAMVASGEVCSGFSRSRTAPDLGGLELNRPDLPVVDLNAADHAPLAEVD